VSKSTWRRERRRARRRRRSPRSSPASCARPAIKLLVQPRLQRHRVERVRFGRRPWAVERDVSRRPFKRRDGRSVLLEVVGVVAVLAADPQRAAVLECHVLSGGPLWEGGDRHVGGQRVDMALPRADRLAAQVDLRAGLLDQVRAASDAVARRRARPSSGPPRGACVLPPARRIRRPLRRHRRSRSSPLSSAPAGCSGSGGRGSPGRTSSSRGRGGRSSRRRSRARRCLPPRAGRGS
jgi:hypothetical protein